MRMLLFREPRTGRRARNRQSYAHSRPRAPTPSWREALDHPPIAPAPVPEPVVEAVGAALPELDGIGPQAQPAPALGARNGVRIASGRLVEGLLEHLARRDDLGLGARQRAELRAVGTRGEVGVVLGGRERL